MSAQTPQTDNPETGYRSHYAEHEHNRELCRALEADRDRLKALCEELKEALEDVRKRSIRIREQKAVVGIEANFIERVAQDALKKAEKP